MIYGNILHIKDCSHLIAKIVVNSDLIGINIVYATFTHKPYT